MGGKRRVDHGGRRLLAVVDKQLHAVAVQNQPELQFPVSGKHRKFPDVDNVAGQAALGAVNAHNVGGGLEPDGGKVLPVPGHIDLEPAVHGRLVAGADGDRQIDKPAADALQGRLAGHHHIPIGDFGTAAVFQFPHGRLDQPSVADVQLAGEGHLAQEPLILQMAV